MSKRIFDIFCALCVGLLTLPITLVTAMAIWLKMGRPILFQQRRPGLHGAPFTLYKFRTMTSQPLGQHIVKDDLRLTSLGRFLRRYSLDELPQLFNVLKGDLSIVGPRPLLMEYLPLYTGEQQRRHAVKPGITGWAQINGRNAISWEEKFALDIWYVEHCSFFLDLKIILATLTQLFKPQGVNAPGEQLMSRFMGSKGDQHEGRSDH